jgi:hypothetical protein
MTIRLTNKARHQEMLEKAILLTGYSQDQMNMMIFDMAVDYLKGMKMCEDWIAQWLKEPIFWSWWRKQWTLIDEMFWYRNESYIGKDSVKKQLCDYYKELHSNINYFPDAIIYEKIHSSYEQTSQEILRRIRIQNNV